MDMRKIVIVAFALALCAEFTGAPPAFADCRSENTACVKGVSSPFDSVACGSLFRTCAAHHAQAQARQKQNAMKPTMQNPSHGSGGGGHSGRR
jgi:hypothetical protein